MLLLLEGILIVPDEDDKPSEEGTFKPSTCHKRYAPSDPRNPNSAPYSERDKPPPDKSSPAKEDRNWKH
jgi:hypothetical protein